mmetsp:Transcript_19538/g.44912  ORF Transcript_19538/g.44912 Transcript_19538/m.44912 type:complete len:131 (+) Transcript_19538:1144-1536(+)
MLAFFFVAFFATVYYPRQYTPIALKYAKQKYEDYEVAAKMAMIFQSLKQMAAVAYQKAITSPAHAKACEYYELACGHAATMYTVAASSNMATRGADATNRMRARLGAELAKLRPETATRLSTQSPTQSPV